MEVRMFVHSGFHELVEKFKMWSVNINEVRKTLFQGGADETMSREGSIDSVKGFAIGDSIIISLCSLGLFNLSLTWSGSFGSWFVDCDQLRCDHKLFYTLFPASTCFVDEATCLWCTWYQMSWWRWWGSGCMCDIEVGREFI